MKKTIMILLIAVLLLCAAGCGLAAESDRTAADAADLDSVMQEMLETVVLPEMMTLKQDDLLDYFGLEAQWCAQAAACVNSNGYEKDEIVLVRATDAQSATRVKECLQTSLENAANETQNYLPQQYAIIRNCKVESKDLYVWLFISDAAEQMKSVLDKYI